MYSTAHLALGLIIGKVTGDYPTAIITSVALDFDHLWPHVKNKTIFKIKEIWNQAKLSGDTSRNILHSFIFLVPMAVALWFFDHRIALVFIWSFLGHFFLDAIDDSDFWPLFPFKRINSKGFIGYYSRTEVVFTIILFLIYFSLFLF
jgi:hypothetical protein